MSSNACEMTDFFFKIEQVDEWPPVGSECLYFVPLSEGYKLASVPLFLRNLSVGDVVTIEAREVSHNGHVVHWADAWKVVCHSSNTNIWLLDVCGNHSAEVESVLSSFREKNCDTVSCPAVKTYGVSVPESLSLADVDELLGRLPEDVAIAYPSLRHSA